VICQNQRGVYVGIYLVISLALGFHCYRHPAYGIDLLAYAGNVALSDTNDPVRVHEIVYREPLTPHLRGTDADDLQARDLRRRAADAYYSAAYLPYFSVKPLYVLSMIAVHQARASVFDSSRIVSAVCFLGIAGMLWLYTGSLLSLAILLLPEVFALGELNEPDGMSTLLLLIGIWAVMKQKKFAVLPLLLSVWVRPENAIFCVLFVGTLLFHHRIDLPTGLVTAVAAVSSFVFISHFGYGWKSLYFHTFANGEPTAIPHFGLGDYFAALDSGFREVVHGSVPIFFLLWLVTFQNADFETRLLLGASGFYSLLRFCLFPSYEYRYYALFFLVTGIAAVRIMAKAPVGARALNLNIGKKVLSLSRSGQ